MDIKTAISARHSVRSYENRPIKEEARTRLEQEIAACNREGDLHIQLVTDEARAFDSFMAHYGKFSGVTNYIALVGKKSARTHSFNFV